MDFSSVMEIALASSLILTCVVAIFTLSRFFAGRSRSELEVANITIARIQATLIEKDHVLAEKDAQMAGMSARLAKLDEERKEFGGSKVYEALLAQQQEMALAFREISEQTARHEERAEERSRQMLGLIETVGHELARCFNGKDQK